MADTVLSSLQAQQTVEPQKQQPQQISPSDDELGPALRSLRQSYPALGAPKLLTLLLADHQSWAISEKRLRKALQKEGLSLTTSSNLSAGKTLEEGGQEAEYPTSNVVHSLDLSTWSKKIRVKDFGPKKGKGLVAIERIEEGETLWVEDPIVWAPEACVCVFFLPFSFPHGTKSDILLVTLVIM